MNDEWLVRINVTGPGKEKLILVEEKVYRIRNVKMYNKTLICVQRICRIEIFPDYAGSTVVLYQCSSNALSLFKCVKMRQQIFKNFGTETYAILVAILLNYSRYSLQNIPLPCSYNHYPLYLQNKRLTIASLTRNIKF